MKRFRVLAVVLSILPVLGVTLAARGAEEESKEVWTDANDSTLPADFKFQGEYADGRELGAQVIALGDGAFQAVIYPGGLPGAGWDGEHKCLLDGVLNGAKVRLRPAEGEKQYLAQSPKKFSATSTFPPAGQDMFDAAEIAEGTMRVVGADGKVYALKSITRKSPTLGKKPPEGAKVLFDGSNADAFSDGRVDEQTHLLNTDGHDILTKQKFMNYTMHVEFLLPYRPAARGQGRGNSGFYQVDHYEVQILDSFGLDGKNNECGGIYSKVDPSLNMCLPPLSWQTYDVDFTNAVRDEDGRKIKNARITLKLNGVTIHDDVEIDGVTGGSRGEPEGTPGPIKLQGHGNPLQFRNIWIVERK